MWSRSGGLIFEGKAAKRKSHHLALGCAIECLSGIPRRSNPLAVDRPSPVRLHVFQPLDGTTTASAPPRGSRVDVPEPWDYRHDEQRSGWVIRNPEVPARRGQRHLCGGGMRDRPCAPATACGVAGRAPPGAFSAMRAMKHVAAIAREPHPLGTAAAEPVRAYLLAELKALGFEPEIQQPHDARTDRRSRAEVLTIAARRAKHHRPLARHGAGRKEGAVAVGPLRLTDERPGASDDASGVAAILESLRTLKAGPPPDRDVIALLTDGEEAGLLGAGVFCDEHTWAKDVGVALNFDARGNSGPSYMFEASAGNGWLIEQLAQAFRIRWPLH